MRLRLAVTCCSAIALCLTVAGCGGADVPMQRTYKVTGQVLLDGKPTEGVDVRFIPEDKTNFKMEETPLGHTDAAGKFTLTTYYTGDGAPAGKYLVALAYPDQVPLADDADETAAAVAAAKSAKQNRSAKRFPSLYQVPQKSGLKAEVPVGGIDLPAFDLKSSAK